MFRICSKLTEKEFIIHFVEENGSGSMVSCTVEELPLLLEELNRLIKTISSV